MQYTCVLQSQKDNKMYTGCTKDLKLRFTLLNLNANSFNRVKLHSKGQVESTRDRRPLKLIYYEACLNKDDVFHREKYLKTYLGKQFLHNRLKSYLTG